MFWLARLMRLLRPIPPTPTPAMLSVSLGAVKPRPSTRRGTMAKPAVPALTFFRKVRRDTPSRLLAMAVPPPLILTDSEPARRLGDTIPRHDEVYERSARFLETALSVVLFRDR